MSVQVSDAFLKGVSQGLGGFLAVFITYPLQNLVNRFQINSLIENNAPQRHSTDNAAAPSIPPSASDPPVALAVPIKEVPLSTKLSDWDLLMQILQEEGIGKLYTGVTLTMIGTFFQQSISSSCVEYFKGMYSNQFARDAAHSLKLIFGIIAGMITATIINPIWVISTRLNARQKLRRMQQQAQQAQEEESNGRVPTIATGSAETSVHNQMEEPVSTDINIELSVPSLFGNGYDFLLNVWCSIVFGFSEIVAVMQGVLKEGISKFWSGISLAYILAINPAIQTTTFDFVENLLVSIKKGKGTATGIAPKANRYRHALQPVDTDKLIVASSIAKTVATIATYPLTLLKSRLYVSIQSTKEPFKTDKQGISTAVVSSPVKGEMTVTSANPDASRTMITEFFEVLRRDGFFGLYRGMPSKIIQNVLMSVLTDIFGKFFLITLKKFYLRTTPSEAT